MKNATKAAMNRRRLIRSGLAGAAASLLERPGLTAAQREAAGAASAARVLRVAFVRDTRRHAEANRAGRNYWDAYLPEILDELGLRAEAVPPETLADRAALRHYATLILGELDVTQAAAANLEDWVRAGGTLIAFATRGIDALCGNRIVGRIAQRDEFTCAATFVLTGHPVASGVHSALHPQQRLLIFSDAWKARPEKSAAVAHLFENDGTVTACAAVTGRRLARGWVFYFGFRVPQTMWVLHQGRPVDRDYDGDGRLRRSDAVVIRPHPAEVGYADEILFLLQNMVGRQPHAFVHQLPPLVGSVLKGQPRPGTGIPAALFHWGGDDEGSPDGIQLASSNWLREQGLPYHVNALPRRDGRFGLSIEDARRIQANGHEVSLHFNFVEGFAPGAGFSREDVLSQAENFRRCFDVAPTCTVNHISRWFGWAEPAKWMREAGIKADNTFVHAGSPPPNPVNQLGFSFGTAFPFWFFDDWRGANRKIEFLEAPMNAYECGYDGKETTDFATVHKVIDTAVRYHLAMNMFQHPIYIATFPACRAAIQEGLRYLREKRLLVVHMGNDELYHWWKARSDSCVSEVSVAGKTLTVTVESAYPAGVIVKVPLGKRTARFAAVNGEAVPPVAFKTETRFGQTWALVAVPAGESRIVIALG